MNTRCRGDDTVCRIAQGAQRRHLQCYLISQWKNLKDRVGLQIRKELAQWHSQRIVLSASKNSDLHEADRAEGQWFTTMNRRLKSAKLYAG